MFAELAATYPPCPARFFGGATVGETLRIGTGSDLPFGNQWAHDCRGLFLFIGDIEIDAGAFTTSEIIFGAMGSPGL